MARPLRIEFPGAYYHIMNRGLARQIVFTDHADRRAFLGLLADCHEMWGVRVLAYCLLNTHYHLLVQTPEASLSRIMRHVGGVYTQRYNRRHGRDGPLFRGRYTAILVDADSYLLAVARYIHQNPVGAGLVRSPETYEWSSFRLYLAEGRCPTWLDTAELLGRFPRQDARAAFRAFMKSALDKPVQAFYEKRWRGAVLGTEEFRGRVRKRLRSRSVALEGVPEVMAYLRPDAKSVIRVVEQVTRTGREALFASQRGKRNPARALAMYACRRLAGMKLQEIAKMFGASGYSAVRSVIGRTEAELRKGGTIATRFEQIRHRLET